MSSPTIKYVGIYAAFAATAIALTATLGFGPSSPQTTSMTGTSTDATAPATYTTTLTPLTTLAPPSTLDAPPALSAPPAPPLP